MVEIRGRKSGGESADGDGGSLEMMQEIGWWRSSGGCAGEGRGEIDGRRT